MSVISSLCPRSRLLSLANLPLESHRTVMRHAHYVPAEIWLHIASYMSIRELERLVLLNRTFADLAGQHKRQWALVLDTNARYYKGTSLAVATDFVAAADRIAKKLQKTIESRGDAHLKRLVFYYRTNSQLYTSTPKRHAWEPSFVARTITKRTFRHRLRKLYEQLGTVEALSFVYVHSDAESDNACCFDYLSTGRLWQVVAANLRELNIVTDVHDRLSNILSYIPAGLSCRRLEVLRFSYGMLGGALSNPKEPGLKRLYALLVEAAGTLHTLEIRTHTNESGYLALFEQLFPATHFHQLRRFSFVIRPHGSPFRSPNVPATAAQKLWSFVDRHNTTLKSIKIQGPPIVYCHLLENSSSTPAGSYKSQASVAISIQVECEDRLFDITISSDNLPAVRKCVVELYMVHPRTMFLTGLAALTNLRRLVLTFHSREPSGLLANLAIHAPELVSLSCGYLEVIHYHHPGDVMLLAVTDPVDALRQWKLKDLSIYKADVDALVGYHCHRVPSWSRMRQVAALFPPSSLSSAQVTWRSMKMVGDITGRGEGTSTSIRIITRYTLKLV
ncbi:hypothetical protein BKA62DRAFT_161433 [Auriculariales sp. MPI-PUGE-AT-0066]|nr:hypothetical protein BKA62DRAFT_161433 [Auriculariales sp. MPI-PUGE-AT-0066]